MDKLIKGAHEIIDLTLCDEDCHKLGSDKKRNHSELFTSHAREIKTRRHMCFPVNKTTIGKTESRDSILNNKEVQVVSRSVTPSTEAQSAKHKHKLQTMHITLELYKHDGDDGISTREILPLIGSIPSMNMHTCFGETPHLTYSHNATLEYQSFNVKVGALLRESKSNCQLHLLHIRQQDKWSCGFRNLQMILSALLPNLELYHPYFSDVFHILNYKPKIETDHSTSIIKKSHPRSNMEKIITIPSIHQLQFHLEKSWAEGFDSKGAEHYGHQIVGKRSEIGAVEVSSLLSYFHIDSVVVQFIVCKESRSKLGKFVWAYFNKSVKSYSCSFCKKVFASNRYDGTINSEFVSNVLSSRDLAQGLLHSEHTPVNLNVGDDFELCTHPLLPLYLQWEGHSVTIVGVEKCAQKLKDSGIESDDFNLLVFDPLKNGKTLKQNLFEQLSIGIASNSKIPHSYELKCFDIMRLPVCDLLEKDCQIIVTSLKHLDFDMREKAKIRSNAITAASDEVNMRLLQR